MTRGQRQGCILKSELTHRLSVVASAQNLAPPPSSTGLTQLLGHAIHHNVVTAVEVSETRPRSERTIPCHLNTYIRDEGLLAALDRYVVTASKLYRRGSIIANVLAVRACGSRLPSGGDITVPVWRPRYQWPLGQDQAGLQRLCHTLLVEDIRDSDFKHVFLPERWPSSKAPRSPEVDAVLASGVSLPLVPAWLNVMSASGWDNAINRMATKYHANIQVSGGSSRHTSSRLLVDRR